MRIIAAFLLLSVFAGLALFLTFTSSWGTLLLPHAAANEAVTVVEEPTPTPDWEGKYVVEVNQPVVLRSDPFAAAQTVGLLRKGEKVALKGCDVSGLWCQTEAGDWFVSYMVGTLPEGLPVLEGVKVQAAPTKAALIPTPDPAALMPTATPTAAPAILLLPTPTPAPTADPDASLFEILSVDGRITESNSVWWKYAYIVELQNTSDKRLLLDATIEFLDTDGFVVDDDRVYDFLLEPGETSSMTGYALIDASVAANVDGINAKVGVTASE